MRSILGFIFYSLVLWSCCPSTTYTYVISNQINDTLNIEIATLKSYWFEDNQEIAVGEGPVYDVLLYDGQSFLCPDKTDSIIKLPPFKEVCFSYLKFLESTVGDPDERSGAPALWQSSTCLRRIFTSNCEISENIWRNKENWFIRKKKYNRLIYVFIVD